MRGGEIVEVRVSMKTASEAELIKNSVILVHMVKALNCTFAYLVKYVFIILTRAFATGDTAHYNSANGVKIEFTSLDLELLDRFQIGLVRLKGR